MMTMDSSLLRYIESNRAELAARGLPDVTEHHVP
jgi:hypothetical protein